MKNIIKLPLIVFLPIIVYSREIPFNSATLSYMIEDKIYTYEEKIPLLNILKTEKNNNAVTVIKSSEKHYIKDKLEVEFIVLVTLNRDVNDLTISDNIVEGFQYKDTSLRLNNRFPQKFKLLDKVLTIPIGDVKSGYSYKMRYLTKPIS
jgi:hypothetical protein